MEENNADVVYGSRVSKENKNNLNLYIVNRGLILYLQQLLIFLLV